MKRDFITRELNTRNVEIRENEGTRTIEGFIPYNSRSEFMGFYEYIAPSAFRKTLADMSDVRALVNHDSSQLIGRVSNGSLRLRSEDDGLHIECDLPKTSYADDLYNLIRGGYNNGLSFGFNIIQEDYGTEEVDGRTYETHTLKEVRLLECSFGVSFPAYSGTNSVARNIRGIDLTELNTTLNKDSLTEEDETVLRAYIEKLNGILEPAPTEERDTEAEDVNTSAVEPSQQFRDLNSKLDNLIKGVNR